LSTSRIRISAGGQPPLARSAFAAVREALLTLHPDFRAVVVLRDVNELSYEEMSALCASRIRAPSNPGSTGLARMLAKALRAPRSPRVRRENA